MWLPIRTIAQAENLSTASDSEQIAIYEMQGAQDPAWAFYFMLALFFAGLLIGLAIGFLSARAAYKKMALSKRVHRSA